MSMILRRSKKKLKKAQQLQEAQQQAAFLASLQQQESNGISPSVQYNNHIGFPSVGIFEKDEDFQDGSTGSDPDAEMLDSLSLASTGQLHMKTTGRDISPPVAVHANTLPPNYQFTFQPAVAAASSVPSTSRDHSFRRGSSQPVFTSIPATLSEIPEPPQTSTVTVPSHSTHVPSHSTHIRQKSNGHSSPKRIKEQRRQLLSQQKSELIATALSFGLGRGIDATDKTPWLNKKPYQIRRVHTSIGETNEGGILVNYNHEIQGIAESDESFLNSLTPPESTVTIHIEDELDRNVSSTRRIIGRKVVNQSINFQSDFEEKYTDGDIAKLSKDSLLVPKDPAEVVYNTQGSGYTFEERVCQWLMHRLAQKYGFPLQKMDESPVDHLAKIIQSKPAQNISSDIRASCHELVQGLKVTHYVTGIQLGALEYRVMSDGQFHKKIALEGAFGVDKLATILSTQQMELSKKESKKCSQLRHIGKIENDRVAKGSPDEAVIQIQVQPITRLIKLPLVKSSLTAALEKYMEGSPSMEGGPFVIKCTGRDLYLTVNKFNNYEVEGTDIPTEASLFYFQTTDDGVNPFEFHIAYYGEDADPNDQTTESSSICRYLEAPLNALGRCPGPLLMKHSVKVKNTRFTLRSRLSKKSNKSHLEEWIAGEDAFYVACATKKYQHGSYLAIKNIKNTGDLIGKHFFMTCCDSSIHNHNGENSLMLFQLCTKESIINKGHCGGETPGKLPLIPVPAEVLVRNEEQKISS